MMNNRIISTLVMLFMAICMNAQRLAVNTNLLADGLTTPSFGFELTTGNVTTLHVSAMGGTPLIGADRFLGVTPEFRYWFGGRAMYHHYIGLGALAASYKVTPGDVVHDGNALGGGITFGYAFNLGSRVTVNFHSGLGMVHYMEKRWGDIETPEDSWEINRSGNIFVPINMGITLSLIIK